MLRIGRRHAKSLALLGEGRGDLGTMMVAAARLPCAGEQDLLYELDDLVGSIGLGL